jgi:hypothetical protein
VLADDSGGDRRQALQLNRNLLPPEPPTKTSDHENESRYDSEDLAGGGVHGIVPDYFGSSIARE